MSTVIGKKEGRDKGRRQGRSKRKKEKRLERKWKKQANEGLSRFGWEIRGPRVKWSVG